MQNQGQRRLDTGSRDVECGSKIRMEEGFRFRLLVYLYTMMTR